MLLILIDLLVLMGKVFFTSLSVYSFFSEVVTLKNIVLNLEKYFKDC